MIDIFYFHLSDHVAVALYLQEDFHSLKLHFPAKWQASSVDPQFQSTASECDDYLKNPGGVANWYHKLFSDKIKENSLLQIESAIALGATVREHKGFHERNTAVAQSPYLLAFTWGEVRGMNPRKEEPTTHGPSAKKLDYIFLSVHWMKTNLPLKISKNITYEEIFLQWKKRN